MDIKPETHDQYIKRSLSIEKELLQTPERFVDIESLDEKQTIAYVERIKSKFTSLSIATCRLYRRALIYVYELYNNKLLTELVTNIKITKETTKPKGTDKKTSSLRTKEISESDIEKLLEYQKKDKSEWRKLAIDFIIYTIETGMRSTEWTQCSFEKFDNPDKFKRFFIKIKNAKYRNKNKGGTCVAYAEFRHLPMENIFKELPDKDGLKIIDMINKYSIGQKSKWYDEMIVLDPVTSKEITRKKFLDRLRIEICHINNTIFGKNGRRITMHSARHQFIANLKKHPDFDPIYCSIVVGHLSPKSARRYYAKKKVGRSSIRPLPTLHAEDVKNFFEAHPTNKLVSNAERIKYKQPIVNEPSVSSKGSFSP